MTGNWKILESRVEQVLNFLQVLVVVKLIFQITRLFVFDIQTEKILRSKTFKHPKLIIKSCIQFN